MARRHRRKKGNGLRTLTALAAAIVIIFAAAIYIRTNFNKDIHKQVSAAIIETGKIEPAVAEKEKNESKPEQGIKDKQPEVQPEENKSSQTPPAEQPVKANQSSVDPVIENYLNIYVNLANDSELDFYYLDNVVMKNSAYYRVLSSEIQKLRQSGEKYVLNDFTIDKISKGKNDSELIVQVTQSINDKTNKFIYTVYFDKSGVFIKDRK